LIRFVKQRGTNLWWLTMMHTNTPIIFDSTPTPSDTKEKTLVGASQTGERPTGLYFVDVPGEGPCLEC
jgi:hypothetical protein